MLTSETMDLRELNKPGVLDKIKDELNLHTEYDPATTLKLAELAIKQPEKLNMGGDEDDDEDEDEEEKLSFKGDPVSRAMTLSEFKNGALMISAIPDQYRTFAIDMLCKLQEDYTCILISEKALSELAVINFVRTIEVQRKITNYIDMNSLTDNGVKYLAIMSKELDRANRHFITAIQTLKMLKQAPISVNVKANTAIVGQNQLIQENQNVKSI